jgi:GNAT superfamily N-acetyltransferase
MEYTIKEVKPGMEIPAEMLDLYKDAFPPEERRPWDTPEDVRLFMDGHPRMHMKIMETDNRFVGFLIYWHLTDNVIYGEHLATLPHLRGNGLGAKFIADFERTDPDMELVLEVEPPVDELTLRRIGFYRRLGLVLHTDIRYIQPPYAPGQDSIELKLMSTPGLKGSKLSEHIVPTLRSTIYGV